MDQIQIRVIRVRVRPFLRLVTLVVPANSRNSRQFELFIDLPSELESQMRSPRTLYAESMATKFSDFCDFSDSENSENCLTERWLVLIIANSELFRAGPGFKADSVWDHTLFWGRNCSRHCNSGFFRLFRCQNSAWEFGFASDITAGSLNFSYQSPTTKI